MLSAPADGAPPIAVPAVGCRAMSRPPPRPGSLNATREEDAWVLVVEGEHDLATVHLLEEQMERMAVPGATVVIDLSSASFVDCRVVAWLVGWCECARNSDGLHLSVAIGQDGSFIARLLGLLHRLELIGPLPTVATRADALSRYAIDGRR